MSSGKDLLKSYLSKFMGESDFDDLQDEAATEKMLEAFQDLYERFQTVSQENKKLQSQLSSRPQSSKGQGISSFNQMIGVQQKIIKLQAWWKKEYTLKKLQKQIRDQKAAMSIRKEMESPEESAIREFTQQLQQKKITPEGFYRVCDSDYKQTVKVAMFKDQLTKLGIQLSRGQMSRLILILDEDMEGSITREEYYNALEAYNASGEKHKSIDGSIYHPFEHRCLFKLIVELKKKDISYLEMFNACDINDDARVNISEIMRFVEGLSPDFKQKEIYALMNYLDIDKNSIVDKDEFLRQLSKGEQTYKQTQILNKQIAERKNVNSFKDTQENNFFEEEVVGPGDQGIFTGVSDFIFGKKEAPAAQPKQTVQDKPPVNNRNQAAQQSLTPDMQKRKLIIEKMEKEGMNFQSFFNSIKGLSSGGLIPLGPLLKAFEASYSTISAVDRNFLIKDCIVERGKVDYIQLEELFTKFSKNLKPTISQTFSVIANNIAKRMGGSGQESIRQFFKAQNVSDQDLLSDIEFTQMFQGKFSTLSSRELEQAFNSLNVDMDGFVQVRDLMEVLLSYINSTEKTAININELTNLIPGFEAMSPRTRCEEVIEYIINELKKKNLKPINVFKMADAKNSGGVQAMMLEITFKKMLPHIKNEVFQESLNAFNLKTQRDIISRQDFETVFNEDMTNSKYIPHSSTGMKQSQTDFAKSNQSLAAAQTEDESIKWIKQLDNAMLREGISPSVAFKAADVNHNGVVTVDELRESIKKLIPDNQLSLVELKKIMVAFDQNKNGLIDEQEFIGLFEKARNSTVTIVNSPQKGRMLKDDFPEDRKSKLPLKDSIGNQKAQPQVQSDQLTTVVADLDKKINLKKIFGEIPINEEGQFVVNHIGRRLKSEQAFDGTTLKPQEYLPIIKFLDKGGVGLVDVKEVLKFLEKFSKSNQSDYQLELKSIANYIEYQMKNRFTAQFLLNNTKLKQGSRIMEVELITELQKLFGVSSAVGVLIYKRLKLEKGNNDVTIDDISDLIDQYRIVKVEKQKAPTESQKLDPQQIIARMAKAIVVMNLKAQDLLNSKLLQVNTANKMIPFKDFYEIFVDQYELLTRDESKAVFQFLKPQNVNINGIILADLQAILQKFQPSLKPKEQPALSIQPTLSLDKTSNVSPSFNERGDSLNIQSLVIQIESQIGQPIENAIEEIYESDVVAVPQFTRKLQSVSPKVDKALTTQLAQSIDTNRSGKILIKELIAFLKKLEGKYDSNQIFNQLQKDIEEPVAQFLENQGFSIQDSYTKNYFMNLIIAISNISRFQSLCLFYDLCGDTDELQGKVFLQKIVQVKNSMSRTSTAKFGEESKKAHTDKKVSFQEPTKPDVSLIVQVCQQFVSNFNKVCTDKVVQNAVSKFKEALSKFKSSKELVAKFDKNSNGFAKVDQFKQTLDELFAQITNEEKLVLTFLAINSQKSDPLNINLTQYFRQIAQTQIDEQIISVFIDSLKRNLPAVKTFLSQNDPTFQDKPVEMKGTQSLPPPQSSVPELQQVDSKVEKKKQKKIAKMKDIIEGLSKAFTNKTIKQGLIDLFNNAAKQKLQYNEFYDYLEQSAVKFQIPDESEQYEIFEAEVDVMQKGRFKFIDFIDFCQKYGIDFKSNLAKAQTEVIRKSEAGEMVLKCEQLTYKIIPSEDYYNGIQTILNSEEAALVMCEKLYQEIPQGEEFFDPDFGPKDDNDIKGSSLAMYCTGVPPPGYTKPEDVIWLRPEDITDNLPQFIDDGTAANDVKQGAIGDCWFIGALSVIATRDELLRGGIGNIPIDGFEADQESALLFSKGVYPPLFHCYKRKGIYVLRFFKEFKWRYVIIDDRLPCYFSKKLIFGQCKQVHELWVPLIEKAYAKLHGCYETLISGFIDDALTDMTGLVAEKLMLHNEQKMFPHKSITNKDSFWEMLQVRVSESCMMGCSVTGDTEKELMHNGELTGIRSGHAYGIMDAFELHDPNMVNPRKTHRLLRVRNPWGAIEWKGKWGDKSDEIIKYKDLIDKYLNDLDDADEKFVPGEEDGTFLINYSNWRDVFNNMYICIDFPNSWSAIRYRAEWDASCSGGIPSPMTEENKKRWAKNPQYKFTAYKEFEMFISLAQPDGRGKQADGKYYKFPYTELIHPCLFTVCELPQGKTKLEAFDKNLVKATSLLKEHKEVSLRVKLPKGSYVIVPSTRSPGEYGTFYLSLYFNLKMKHVHIQRIDQPDKNEFENIMEENESAAMVQDWKVDLCQKRIGMMIGEEDQIKEGSSSINVSRISGGGAQTLAMKMNQATMKDKTKAKLQGQQDESFGYNEAFPDDEVIE